MKKSIYRFAALFLCLAALISCLSCSRIGENALSQTEEERTIEKTKEEKAVTVPDPLTWEKINAIPVASPDMTVEELRQICVDYFRLQLTYQWTPSESFTYTIASNGNTVRVKSGTVYGGHLYVTNAVSNLYRMMNYYDEKTGVFSVPTKNGDNTASLIGNQCSYGSFWGWARVSNSFRHTLTNTITPKSGIVPIGPYKSTDSTSLHNTVEICKENGEQVMFRSYAEFLPADGMVCHNGAGHVRMVSEKAYVEYASDGSIDGEKSYVRYLDQVSAFSYGSHNGKSVMIQGGVDEKTTFREMYASGYLPFTLKEFAGLDPVEKGEVTVAKGTVTEAMSLKELTGLEIATNYTVSDVTVKFTDENGNILYENIAGTGELHCYELPLRKVIFSNSIKKAVKDQKGLLTVSCRLGTGESFPIYQGSIRSQS